jgi:outer membrane protein TolC
VLIGSPQPPLPTETPTLTAPGKDAQSAMTADRRPDVSVDRRPDIKVQRKLVTLSKQQVTLSWMQFLPTLNASWQWSYQITDPSAFGSTDRSRWILGLTLDVPLFDEVRYGDLAQRRAGLRRAKLEAKDAIRKAKLEVRTAQRGYRNALLLIETAQTKVQLTRETLKLAEGAYQSGTGPSLAVTDALRTRRVTEIDLEMKRFAAQLALLEFFRATGERMDSVAKINNGM